MKPKILITNHVPDDHLDPLLGLAEIIKGPSGGPMCSRAEVLALAPQLTAIINQHELTVDRELLAAAPKLRIVANVAIGYNNLDIAALDEAGVWGTNCPGVFAESAADHTLALLLAVARQVSPRTNRRSIPDCSRKRTSYSRPTSAGARWKTPTSWDDLRAAQKSCAAAVSGTYLIPAFDLGDEKNIHPTRKRAMGQRIAEFIHRNLKN